MKPMSLRSASFIAAIAVATTGAVALHAQGSQSAAPAGTAATQGPADVNVVNVPTVVWIDERGRIVRPNDVAFGTDTFRHITGLESARPLAALRAWVRGETAGVPPARARALQTLPTARDQQARAEFGLAEWLARRGRSEAAERHFVRAGELAPHDFTIRRGSMPIRGLDPMGPKFREMRDAWVGAGHPYYRPLPDDHG